MQTLSKIEKCNKFDMECTDFHIRRQIFILDLRCVKHTDDFLIK